LSSTLNWNRRPTEREPAPRLHQERLNAAAKRQFEIAFLGLLRQGQELEVVRILDRIAHELRVGRRDRALEARDGGPLPLTQAAGDSAAARHIWRGPRSRRDSASWSSLANAARVVTRTRRPAALVALRATNVRGEHQQPRAAAQPEAAFT
jgi:hypothetical protein